MPKTTTLVGEKAAQTLYYVEEQADRIGLPLNNSVTINFTNLGIPPRDAVPAFTKLRSQRFSPWMRRPPKRQNARPATPTYSYGFENSRDGIAFTDPNGDHNIHVHWAIHIPATRQFMFESLVYSWLDEMVGHKDWPANAIEIKPVTDPGNVGNYPTKGAKKEVASRYGKKHEPQGLIYGKRTGTTKNLGPAARRALDKELGIDRKARHYFGQKKAKQARI